MVDEPTLPTPAEFIRQQLEARGMTQGDLAFVLGVPPPAVNQIATGRRGISADMSRALSAVFDVPAEYILKLQKEFELRSELARAKGPSPTVSRNARIVSTYPVREMVKRGWLDDDRASFDAQLAQFFGVPSVDEVPHLEHAGKKSDYSNIPPAQLAWLFRVRHIASEMVVPAYSEAALRAALPRLQALMIEPEEARHVPRILEECGVRFVIVQALPAAKIDGVCFWVRNNTAPVIGMSIRFDRIDNFWFVLRHEIEHVLRGDGRVTAMIDTELELDATPTESVLPPEEVAANEASLEFCVPKVQLDSWIARKAPFFAERDLVGFAKRLGVHPGLVAGQLRKRTGNYKLFARYLAKIQSAVAPSAVVDGWGQIAPVGQESA
jgi:HTH-type transcriptional regulator/antitoxin HigA